MRTFPAIACALGLSLSLSLAGAVHAGTTGGSGPVAVRPLKLTEYVSLKVQNHGPDKAEGVVYFLDGLDPTAWRTIFSSPTLTSTSSTPSTAGT
jgi:hypothetical protein